MTKPDAGSFRMPFAFKNLTKTGNTSSGNTEADAAFFSTRGYFKKKSGNRQLETGRDLIVSVYEAYCYWRAALESGLSKDTVLVYESKEYRIEDYGLVDEQRQYYWFELSEAH